MEGQKENKIKYLDQSKCKKCGKGIMESKSDGKVYVCSNPNCKTAFWVYR